MSLMESAKEDDMVLDKRGPGALWMLFFNMTHKPFNDPQVREALTYAIDRKAIQDAIWLGDASSLATSPLPKGYIGHIAVEMPAYDPEKAKAILSRKQRGPYQLNSHVISASSEYFRIMTLLKHQFEAVDVHLPLVTVDHSTYHDRIRSNVNGLVLYSAARITHGDVMLGLFYHSSQIPDIAAGSRGTNFSHYRGVDNLLDTAWHSTNQDNRLKNYHEAQKRIMDSHIMLPLVVVPDMSLRNPKRVHNPFDPELGESALHYFYNYPERLKLIR